MSFQPNEESHYCNIKARSVTFDSACKCSEAEFQTKSFEPWIAHPLWRVGLEAYIHVTITNIIIS